MRGFSTLEVLIAFMLLSVTFATLILMLFGAPAVLATARIRNEALATLRAQLDYNEIVSRTQFSAVIATTTEREGIFYSLSVERLADDLIKDVRATATWKDAFSSERTLSISQFVADFRNAADRSCHPVPSGDWKHPQTSERAIVPGDLMPSDAAYGFRAGSLAASRSLLVVAATSTRFTTDPTLLLFSVQESGLEYLSSLDTSSTTAGIADMVIAGRYLYIANASTCAGQNCGQLIVVDIQDPLKPVVIDRLLLARTTSPYAVSGASPAAAKSIAYRDGLVYLGLEQTSHAQGQEFNIIDVANPRLPTHIGGYRIGRTINAISVREGTAFLATNKRAQGDVISLDISEPDSIAEITTFAAPPLVPTSTFGYAHDAVVHGPLVLLTRTYASNGDEFYILDRETLEPISSQNLGTPSRRLSAESIIARSFLAAVLTNQEIQFWDLSKPAAPNSFTSSIPIAGEGVAVACIRNTLYVISNEGGTGRIQTITAL